MSLTSGTATCQVTYTAAGSHSITATYSGDSNFLTSNASLTQQVTAATTNQVASSVNPSVSGQSVTFTATVSSGSGTPTGSVQFSIDGTNVGGTVTFKDSTTTLGTGTVSTTSGVSSATLTTSSLALGSHTITAVYGGSSTLAGSTSSALTQNVDTNLSGYPKLSNGAYNLQNATLTGATLTGATLSGANLSQANLSNANLSGANLSTANLSQANLSSANLSNANLTNANLSQTNLTGATGLKMATLTGVIWSKTTCPDGTLSNNDGGSCLGHL